MILSDRDIIWYLERGSLRIEPLSGDTIRENGVDLRFGEDFCTIKGLLIDTKWPKEKLEEEIKNRLHCEKVGEEGYVIQPHEHVLATTAERVCLPDDLVGLVNLRSTFARLGLYIPPTVVDAGFCGQLTIEIIGGPYPVVVYPGQRFLHLILVKTTSPVARPYRGKYQWQEGVTPAKPDA